MVTEVEPSQLWVIVDGVYLDPYRVTLPVTHLFGRSDPGVQPEAPSVSFGWLGPLTFNYGDTAVSLAMGATLSLEYEQGGGGLWSDIWVDLWSPALPPGVEVIPRIPLFTGRITDLRAEADELVMLTSVTAVGSQAGAAVFPVGYAAYPAQSEQQRVAAINAQTPFNIVNDANPSWPLLATVPNPQGAVEALQATAEQTGAFVWEDGSGQLHYQGSLTRLDDSVELELDEVEIVAPVGWTQQIGNLWNEVEVVWGPEVVAPALRARVVKQDADSYARLGHRHLTIETTLSTEDAADLYASLVLKHWSRAYWDAPQLFVRMDTLAPALWSDLVQLTVNDVILANGVTSSPSTPAGQGAWIIEGWSMTWSRDDATGAIIHERQYAVSDRERWGDQKGQTTTTATIAPASIDLGQTATVTATVRDEDGALLPSGTVEVWDGVAKIGSAAITAGVAHVVAKPTQSGSRTLIARFVGSQLYAPSEGSVGLLVTVPATTTTTLSRSDGTIRADGSDSTTFTATVAPAGAEGSVRWEYQAPGSSSWSTSSTSPLVGGTASKTWTTSTTNGGVWSWRAVYVPSSSHPASTSPTVTVTVQTKETRSLIYSSTDAGTYQADGDLRSDTADAYQGYYSGTNGNQRSIAVFPAMSGDWSGWTPTKLELEVETPHWNSASGGTLVLGNSTAASVGSSQPGSWNDDRQRVSMERGERRWINITSWGLATFVGGSSRSIVFGPGPSTSSTYYGYITGSGSTRPRMRVTGYRWELTR